ncbi:hypothetical protein D3C71_50750 [compost metagenome]
MRMIFSELKATVSVAAETVQFEKPKYPYAILGVQTNGVGQTFIQYSDVSPSVLQQKGIKGDVSLSKVVASRLLLNGAPDVPTSELFQPNDHIECNAPGDTVLAIVEFVEN